MPTKRKAPAKKGLSAKTFQGLNQKRMASKGQGGADRVVWKEGEAVPIQFLTDPTEFREYDQHVFQEDGRWNYVPCAGEDCPLDNDEDEKKRKKSYQFIALVYDLKERKVSVARGPKTVATQIFYRYQRKPEAFKKRVYDVTKFPTTPVSYNFEIAEEPPVNTKAIKHNIDLDEYIDNELKRFYGDEYEPSNEGTSLDDDFIDDDIEDDEDELWTKAELRSMDKDELKDAAKSVGVSIKGLTKSEVIEAILDEQE